MKSTKDRINRKPGNSGRHLCVFAPLWQYLTSCKGLSYAILFLSFFIVYPCFAQQKENSKIELTGTPFGFYIKMENPVQTGYKVLRKEKGNDYKTVGLYSPVSTASDLYRSMVNLAAVFPNFGSPGRVFADTIWSKYQADKASLSQIPYPLMHLSLGNAYLDTSAVLGKTYQYKIVYPESENELESIATVYRLHQPEYSKMKLSKVKNVGRSARLEWATSILNTPPFFELYRKQSAGKGEFKKIKGERGTHTNKAGDSTIFIAIDTSGIAGISYDYFLTSVGYLGNEGNHSDTVRLQLGGRQNVPAIYNFRTRSDSAGIHLSWRALAPNPSLNNILVIRSENYDTGYTLLTTLPVNATQFTDRDVEGGKLYYYQLIVQGAANYSIPTPRVSGKFMGKIQLASPYDFKSNAVKEGIALSWRYKDTGRVKGFKVFRSNHPRHDFEFIGEIVPVSKDTDLMQFTDSTVANEKTTYYYAVAAVSRTSNLSPSSLVVSGQALKTEMLSAPTGLRSLWLNDSVVSVTWTDMALQVPGVSGYKIYRNKEELKAVSDQYLFDSVSINEFTDTLYPGDIRWYWVKAEDVQGTPGGISAPIRIQTPVDRPLPPDVHLYKQNKSVALSWERTLNSKIQKYNIYRATNESETTLLGAVDAGEEAMSYTDSDLQQGELYFYYVTSVDQYDIESNPSKEVRVRF